MTPGALTGKTALVTGSTQGLGLAIADRLAAAGCNIVLNGLLPSEAVAGLRRGLETRYAVATHNGDADLRQAPAIERMISGALERFGSIDILVNNAVVRHTSPIEQFSPEGWDEALAVNLSAAFHTIRLALPGMRQNDWGRIVNVSSIYGSRGAANRVGYVTTKTALVGLTRAIALETAGQNITCNAVAPGTTRTPLHEASLQALVEKRGIPPADAERLLLAGKQPTGRLIDASQVAALVVFLCGPEGASITGAVLPVDGGWSAQ
jgi:3-hydroxybutyrate dehydrogenase